MPRAIPTLVRLSLAACVVAPALLLASCTSAAGPQPSDTSAPVAPSSSASSSPQTSAAPTPITPHDYVAPAAPKHFVLTGAKFTIRAHVCGMPNIRPLDPPGEQHHRVCWVDQGFGVAPGSDTATTYVLGHSWAEDDLEVLNKASVIATRQILTARPHRIGGITTYPVTALNGYRLILTTARGRLVYRVRTAYGVAKDQAGLVPTLMDQKIKRRVALITCAERHGVDYPYDVIIEAFLAESVSRTS